MTKLRTSVPGNSNDDEPLKLMLVTQKKLMLSGLMRVMLMNSGLHCMGHYLSVLKCLRLREIFSFNLIALRRSLAHYTYSLSIGMSCTQRG